jgi:peptidoglycan/LPS O-acetylase OafA/YrhL
MSDAADRPGDPAPPVAAPSKGRRYLTALDGLRAMCAIGVIIIHTESDKHVAISTYIYTGALAGPLFLLFFAISGFVLYRAWARKHLLIPQSRRAPGEPRVGSADGGAEGGKLKFLARRLLRIYPLYWVVATAALVVNRSDTRHSLVDYLQVYLLSPFPHPQALLGLGLGIVVWTLLIDVVFYLYVTVHGSIVSSILKSTRINPFRFEVTSLLVLAVGFSAIHLVKPGPWAALSALPLGMLFAVVDGWQDVEHRRHPAVKFLVRYWWVAAALYVPIFIAATNVVVGYRLTEYSDFLVNYLWIQLVLLAFGLVFLGCIIWGPKQWAANRLLASQFMVRAGTLTYGTYLWHPVVLALLEQHAKHLTFWPVVLITLAVSTVLSVITYRLIELPMARQRTRLRGDASTPPSSSSPSDATSRNDRRTDRSSRPRPAGR